MSHPLQMVEIASPGYPGCPEGRYPWGSNQQSFYMLRTKDEDVDSF
jgi:hypothetical protein